MQENFGLLFGKKTKNNQTKLIIHFKYAFLDHFCYRNQGINKARYKGRRGRMSITFVLEIRIIVQSFNIMHPLQFRRVTIKIIQASIF